MSLLQRLITAAYQGSKGALKAGKGSVDDILRSTPARRGFTGRGGPKIPPGGQRPGPTTLVPDGPTYAQRRGLDGGGSPRIPSGGQRVAPTTAFGGQNPIIGNIRTTPNVPASGGGLKGLMPKGPLDFLGRAGQVASGADIARRVGQGDFKGAALQTALTFPGKTFNAARGLVANPAALTTGAILAGTELLFPAKTADGTMDSPEAKRAEELYRTQQYDREQGADLDMDKIRNLPGGANNSLDDSNGSIVTEDQLRPEEVDTTTKLPPSAEQTMIDPYTYNLAVYGQGRNAAQSQTEMNKVRDLGLAINRSLYPDFNNTKTPNPMLQRMFPETYPGTLNALIEEKGVQKPGSMSQVDADNAIIDSSTMDNKYKVAAATGEVEGLLSAAAQESLRQQFLRGQLKRYSLEY